MSVTRITAPELTFQKGRNEHLRIFGFTQRVIYRYRDGVCRNFKFILPTPSDRVALSAFYCAYSLQTPVHFIVFQKDVVLLHTKTVPAIVTTQGTRIYFPWRL